MSRNQPPFLPLLPRPADLPDPGAAAQDALARAAKAAAQGQTKKAERESRLAERLEKLARSAALHRATAPAPEPDGDVFRLDLERRINEYQLQARRERDELKKNNPAAWNAQYEAARAEALAQVDALWIGDARMFEAPEGGYPAPPFRI